MEEKLFEQSKKLIDAKKIEMENHIKDKNVTHLDYVIKDIEKLKQHIDGYIYLTQNDIDNLLSHLVQYRIALDIPINDIYLARARSIDNKKAYPIYNDISVISYIPLQSEQNASLGRFNKKGQSMYYGTLFNTHDDLNVPFQEIGVEIGDYVNILISHTKDIKVQVIGLFSFVENQNSFIKLHPIFDRINNYYNQTHNTLLLEAIKKVDNFFSDISQKEGNERLYNVTSTLGNIYMESNSTDGIMYKSTKDEGKPNVILKPSSVDKKLKHIEAKISLAKDSDISDEIINKELNKGNIVNCKIEWKY